MTAPRVAINGFGRIGRQVTRCLLGMEERVDLVAINDVADLQHLACLFAFDSVHGHYPGTVEVADGDLVLDGDRLRILCEPEPERLPWRELEADYVLECTGRFRDRGRLQGHLEAGAKRVILSAPGKDVDATLVRGVNHTSFDPQAHLIISNASCTTNCLAPVLKVLHDAFGVEAATMTTVHAYTNDQRLLDSQHKDLRRARAAGLSMIPTTTGAARAIGAVLPELAGKVDGSAIRVPVPNVSVVDLTARVTSSTDAEQVRLAFQAAASAMPGILRTEERALVSIDFNHDPHSAIVDEPSIACIGNRTVRLLAWYDNEWAYAMRTAELLWDIWRAEP